MSDLILYEDEAILVVNKPAGLLSLQDGYDHSLPYVRTVLEPDFGPIWMVHRLDRETSGVMIVARSAAAHHHLNDQFLRRAVRKTYHALVRGVPAWDARHCQAPLRKNGDRQHRTVIDPRRGKPAETDFHVLERFPAAALLAAAPHSGYTHQIRAHSAFLGFPLLGDQLYHRSLAHPGASSAVPSEEGVVPVIARVALHALSIQFDHPLSGLPAAFTAPYPADFAAALQSLRQPA